MKWLDSFLEYSGETSEELLRYPVANQCDALVRGFERGIQRKLKRQGQRSLSPEERLVLAVRALHREVGNGGYDQFLRNSSREFAPTIVDSLQKIGCKKVAAITRKALDELSLPWLAIRATGTAMSRGDDTRDEALERCDREFYKCPEDISRRLYVFIKSNKAHIRF